MLRAFGHRVAMYCNMLGVVGSSLKLVKFEPTTSNMLQQGGQTHATCCTQQCCDMLCCHVAIVWPGLYFAYPRPTLPHLTPLHHMLYFPIPSYPTLPCPSIPYPTLLCASPPYPAVSSTLPYPTMPSPTLPYRALTYPTLPYRALPYSTLLYPTLPYLTLPYPTLPYPTLPYPTLPYPTLPYPTLPYPTLPFPTLPYHALSYPTLPCPFLPYPTVPLPSLPYPTMSSLLWLKKSSQFPSVWFFLVGLWCRETVASTRDRNWSPGSWKKTVAVRRSIFRSQLRHHYQPRHPRPWVR